MDLLRPSRATSVVPLAAAICVFVLTSFAGAGEDYLNPLRVEIPSGGLVESCADPTILRSQEPGDSSWYAYCTGDPLNDADRNLSGGYNYRRLPILRSVDLVDWTYVGDALAQLPTWADSGTSLWAPEIQHIGGQYLLYFVVTNTREQVSHEPLCGSDSAIGVAISSSPAGPFLPHTSPVILPRRAGTGCDFYWTFDPDVVVDDAGQHHIYYGSYKGGVEVRLLSPDGLVAPQATASAIAIANRYEATEVLRHDGWYYLFGSATNCCNGPLTGYGVFAARSLAPTGPFVDGSGVPLLDGRVGGQVSLAINGNRFVGGGHNAVFTDFSGQHWSVYHAVERESPYFDSSPGFTRRPLLLDAIDWVDGWPALRGGWGASSCLQPGPAAQPGETTDHAPSRRELETPAELYEEHSDEFDDPQLDSQWNWIRPPASESWRISGGAFELDTQAAELWEDSNSASVLVRDPPLGDYLIETRLELDLPTEGCCQNYVQAGIVIYGDDDNYLKLVHVSIWETRQIEFAKEWSPPSMDDPRYGGSAIGPPGEWTWLRITRTRYGDEDLFTGYSSQDGLTWQRGGTWTHALGETHRIGLAAFGGAGFTARFDHLRVYELAGPTCDDPTLRDPCDRDADGTGDICDPDDDGDTVVDRLDCAPVDALQASPPPVQSLLLSGADPTVLSWPPAPAADSYDVTRGKLSELSSGELGSCLSAGLQQPEVTDPDQPPTGDGFFYVVRGTDAGCGGPGSWGKSSAGQERASSGPGSCP